MSRNDELLRSLRKAIEAETPDALPQILLRVQQQRGDGDPVPPVEAKTTDTRTTGEVSTFPSTGRPAGRVARRVGGIAAALALAVAGIWSYGYYTPQSIIGFDVNPSVELRVNRTEKVLSATPLNEDAETILDGMDLKNTDLDVAVNALIGSMVKNGYISELRNSILISVDSADTQKGTALQERLSSEVDSLLAAYSVNGAVLSQTLSEDERIRRLAETHSISQGKAALVDRLVSQDKTLTFAGVAALSINDINLLLASRQTDLRGVAASGQASSGDYIGEERAKSIALADAGVAEAALDAVKVKMDCDDGRMEYEVEFTSAGVEYEYEVDAVSGDILESDQEDGRPGGRPPVNGASITGEEAEDIALRSAGLSRGDVMIVKSVSYRKQGGWLYDIIFLSSDRKYSYEVDANTGEVLARYTRPLGASHTGAVESEREKDNVSDAAAPEGSGYIGADRAKSIVLEHAGVDASSIREFACKLDNEDGRMIYEVEFVSGGMEYEYEIDAVSGEVLWWESEQD